MIEFFKTRALENNWSNISTDILDVRDLKSLQNETFSHVITNFGFAPDVADPTGPLKAAKEMWRVLKPGGVAVTTIWAGDIFFPSLFLFSSLPFHFPFFNISFEL